MADPFRIIPTRHLGHGFPIAEAFGCSVSPVMIELFTSVATGYIILHAIHRGLSTGGGPLLVTTFFDTLIFDGLASAIVPSFLAFHVRGITALWLKQQFLRSPRSLASSPEPSPPLLLAPQPKVTFSGRVLESPSSEEPDGSTPYTTASFVPLSARLESVFSGLFQAAVSRDRMVERSGIHSMPPSPLSPSPLPSRHAQSEPELSGEPSEEDLSQTAESPEPYPIVSSVLSFLSRQASFIPPQFRSESVASRAADSALRASMPRHEDSRLGFRPMTSDTAAFGRQMSEPQLPTWSLPFCCLKEDDSPEQSLPASSTSSRSPAYEESPPHSPFRGYKYCLFSNLLNPPRIHTPLEEATATASCFSPSTSSSSPSSPRHPPLSSITKAICGEIKVPNVVYNWGPVVAGLATIAFTWKHIDRLVDEFMNQTLRTVY